MNYKPLLKSVLAEIKPVNSAKEVKGFVYVLSQRLKKCRVKAKVTVGGSFAKNTHLRNKHDVDIFVCFDLKYKETDISRILKRALSGLRPTIVHGSRDYYQIKRGDLSFEVVPVLRIKRPADARNVTDFSPRHVKWVQANVKNLCDDIRLAKKFCQAQKVYGAESYIMGFSGHVLDILVIYYSGFIPFLKAAVKWKQKEIIDFYNKYRGRALEMLNLSKIYGPLIVIDPVQPERNASSALGLEKFNIFRKAAANFLKKPSVAYFEEEKPDFDAMKKRFGNRFILIKAIPLEGKVDIIGGKLLKIFEFVRRQLDEFEVLNSGWSWDIGDNASFWFVASKKELGHELVQRGPPLNQAENSVRFRRKHRLTFVKDGILYAKTKRRFIKPRQLLLHLFKDAYIAERIKKCCIIS